MRLTWSDEMRVMLHPVAGYAELLARPERAEGPVRLARRPFRMALALGTCVSLLNGGNLGPLRLLPAILCWSFVPLLRVGTVFIVARLLARRAPLVQAVDLHGAAQGPWYLWLMAISLLHLVHPAWRPEPSFGDARAFVGVSLGIALAWSVGVRFAFLRTVLGLSRPRAAGAIALMAALFWGTVLSFFLATEQLQPRLIGGR